MSKKIKVSEEDVEKELCKKSFFYFLQKYWHVVIPETPVWNFHIKYICQRMQSVAERIFKGEEKKFDLVVNVPPGTSKSSIISIFFPAWVWTRMPTARILGASYTHNLALDLSRKCRDLVTSNIYKEMFPEIKLRPDQSNKSYFMNTKGGMRFSVGSGGSPMGFHFHLILIDDPINPQEALSETVLQSTNDWIDRQLSTRKIDAKCTVTILVMQRLAQNDPTAEMLSKKKVSHICLPATDEFTIVPGFMKSKYTKVGNIGLLDPIRLSNQVLDEWRARGQYFWSGQYGQDPVPLGGGMFKSDLIRIVPKSEKCVRIFRYWDKAGTVDGGDWTAGVKLGLSADNRLWILDAVRVRLDAFRREKLIRQVAENDTHKVRIGIEQEPGSAGKESAENTARTLIGFRVVLNSVSGKGEKQIRWDPFATQVNAGNVYMVEGPWNKDFLEELKFAPYGTHDDQVDAASGAFSLLIQSRARVGGVRKTKDRGRKKEERKPQEIFRTGS